MSPHEIIILNGMFVRLKQNECCCNAERWQVIKSGFYAGIFTPSAWIVNCVPIAGGGLRLRASLIQFVCIAKRQDAATPPDSLLWSPLAHRQSWGPKSYSLDGVPQSRKDKIARSTRHAIFEEVVTEDRILLVQNGHKYDFFVFHANIYKTK
jgi:hypothetical protein